MVPLASVFLLLLCLPAGLGAQVVDPAGPDLASRFKPPAGYVRVTCPERSFCSFLRGLPLKPQGRKVIYYDGKVKENPGIYAAVIDLPISKKNLHQCADAVMRLRAEWLFAEKRFDDIHFNFLRDGKPRYYKDFVKGDHSNARFMKYMDFIFESANTASLYEELRPVRDILTMQPGDVLIQKGRPFGHAVMVVDMAADPQTGRKVYLLAQSYMPAQELQVLQNPMNKEFSPWYRLDRHKIITPEWEFGPGDLRRFEGRQKAED